MFEEYGAYAQFFLVYIKEAHPTESWPIAVNRSGKTIDEPVDFDERQGVADTCSRELNLSIPCLVDDMDNNAARAYRAHPDRLYVVGKDGRIVYTSDYGPYGFKPDEMKPYLIGELRRIGTPV